VATVVFFTPHQDDETLAMGPGVRHHLEAGHDVHIVQMTFGGGSAARPATGLSLDDFIAARDDELYRATRQMGIRTPNCHISPLRVTDGVMTVAQAEDIMRAFYADHPGAWCKTYTYLNCAGRHPDHVAAGQAALNLLHQGLLPNLRSYVEPWLISTWRTANPGVTAGAERAASKAAVLRGFDQYQLADAAAGMYGIGYLSVGAEFEAARPDPVSYYHVPA
jgi:LmbE family N-acetylglucosaminyl deacetylase